jgi:hypothetical protein
MAPLNAKLIMIFKIYFFCKIKLINSAQILVHKIGRAFANGLMSLRNLGGSWSFHVIREGLYHEMGRIIAYW